jgi:ribosomal protein S18 acetylase RimI-like enzyme
MDPAKVIIDQVKLVEDAWLAARLRKPAFHVVGNLEHLANWQRNLSLRLTGRPFFADIKVPVEDIVSVDIIQRLGFKLIEAQLSFALNGKRLTELSNPEISFARPEMAESVGRIAEQFLTEDRFHRDPAIRRELAIEIKREWAKNFFSGLRGDWMVVACRRGAVIGFLLLLRSPREELVIDLIAVHADYRRQGIARDMIDFAMQHCGMTGPIVVGTQLANVSSIRLYESIGFRLQRAQYVYHYHGHHVR